MIYRCPLCQRYLLKNKEVKDISDKQEGFFPKAICRKCRIERGIKLPKKCDKKCCDC